MSRYRRKFDAKAYWAYKPLCTVCKKHKVKSGTVCYECKKLNEKIEKLSLNQKNNDDKLIEMKIAEEKEKIIRLIFSELQLSENTLICKSKNGIKILQNRSNAICDSTENRTLIPALKRPCPNR